MLVSPPDLKKTEKEHSTQCAFAWEIERVSFVKSQEIFSGMAKVFSASGEKAIKLCLHFSNLPNQRVYETESVCMLHNFSRYLQGATCRNPH